MSALGIIKEGGHGRTGMVGRHGSDPRDLELPKLMRLANHPTPTLACLPSFLVRPGVLRSDMS